MKLVRRLVKLVRPFSSSSGVINYSGMTCYANGPTEPEVKRDNALGPRAELVPGAE